MFNGVGTDGMSDVVQDFLRDYADMSSNGVDFIRDILDYDIEEKDYIYFSKHLSSWMFTFRKELNIEKLANWSKEILTRKKDINPTIIYILLSVIFAIEFANITDENKLLEKYKDILKSLSLETLYNSALKIANLPIVRNNLRKYNLQHKLTHLFNMIENESYKNTLKEMNIDSIIQYICKKIDLFISNRHPETKVPYSTSEWLRTIVDIFKDTNSAKKIYKTFNKQYSGYEIKISKIVTDKLLDYYGNHNLENLEMALSSMYNNPSLVYSYLLGWTI